MRLHRVRDGFRLAVAAGEVGADLSVRTLDLVGHRLADVVKQRGPARGVDRSPELGGDHAGEVRALDQMVEHVLPVAGTELELAQELNQLRIETLDSGLEGGALALLHDPLLDLRPRQLVLLLDQRRVDSPVGDQALQSEAGDLAAHPVKAREHDGGRSLVDDDVHPHQLLECPDVAAVAADDPPLHLVARQFDQARRALAGMPGGQPLHGHRENVPGAALGLPPRLLIDLLQPHAGLVAGLLLHIGEQHLLGL
jgi:hypothetical protein